MHPQLLALRRFVCFALAATIVLPLVARGDERAADAIATPQGVVARGGMVVAQEARAAQIGLDILKNGGNAIDAAVATGFALAVSYPRAGYSVDHGHADGGDHRVGFPGRPAGHRHLGVMEYDG